jgi:hypothetical protein
MVATSNSTYHSSFVFFDKVLAESCLLQFTLNQLLDFFIVRTKGGLLLDKQIATS